MPGKQTATTSEQSKYCRTCGRLISANHRNFEERKYCSKACGSKNKRPNSQDLEIEKSIVELAQRKDFRKDGVSVDYVQQFFAGQSPHKVTEVDQSNSTASKAAEDEHASSDDDTGGVLITDSGRIQSRKANSDEVSRYQQGMRQAQFRERVRRAARRVVAFGAPEGDGGNASVTSQSRFECIQHGQPIEASFAKGDWMVRLVER